MKPLFRVVGGLDLSGEQDPKRALAAARKRARPILRAWLQRVEHHVMAGQLAPLDLMMAKELTNYPSANEGRCYAGQERLGAAVGGCDRTARRSLKRLCDAELLTTKRGRPGRPSASWTFCVNGVPIFGGGERTGLAADRTTVSGPDRATVSSNPSEPDPIERKPSPPTPSAAEATPLAGRLKEGEPSGGAVLEGEVLGPATEPDFDTVWKAINSSQPGLPGPAMAAWRRLSPADRQTVFDLAGPHGLDLGGVWLSTWLKERRFAKPRLGHARNSIAAAMDRLQESIDSGGTPPRDQSGGARGTSHSAMAFQFARRASGAGQPETVIVEVAPHTSEWRVERARRVQAGEPTKLMDERAAAGKGWTVRLIPTAEAAE